jgi:tetratricopeptide (TPR) repeat protein
MKSRFLICIAVGAVSVWGETVKPAAKPADMCSPPPGSIAPSLPAKILEGQGTVHLPITTRSEEAQKFFDQGVAQMHSFWAREAERSFLQAAALDPEAPMPYWGIAMVAAGDWRPRFQIDTMQTSFVKSKSPIKSRAIDAARKAVELSQVPGKATEVEKMYITSVAARRDVKQKDPDEAFVKGLRTLLAKYPDEVEAKLDLALMIMRGFTLPDRKPRAQGSTEAAAILRELAIKVPNHPGVHHYIIHGFEGSTFAKDAWPSCKRYSELVTNIPHALHMPGHIYSQTGKWEEGINSFSAAADNERSYMKADALYGNGHHGHNVHYLATSYSFQGQYDKAIEAAAGLLAFKETPREAKLADNVFGAYPQGWFATLRTLVQFEKWDEILKGGILPEPTKARQLAWMHWAKGLAYSAKGQVVEATSERKAMDEALASYRQKTKLKTPEELVVARKELDGHIDIAAKRIDKGIRTLQAAATGERHLRYTEPPFYPRPVSEQLGRVALKNGKLPEAERAFRQALEQYPASAHALAGLRDTLQKGGKPLEAGQ